ncbi:MAG TPA: phosphoribosylamine--glycine ligase [Tepidisphaeraceae bacterium]|jgi:phosphoribosylamine--glycine ligase|nr:phosphoribosylamine--glycine ligase [Tepidisphaeraceae bacterium]
MKVLLIGNGGREHALAWKLAASPRVTALYCAPGNPGTAQVADNVPIAATDLPGIEKFIRQNNIEFVVIGPEDPLAMGLTDRIMAMGVKVFGPTKEAARLEGDKWFAKELMRQQAIPTAEARTFTDASAAEEFIRVRDEPMVVKAAGLAKGKGVTVCYRSEDALAAVDQIMRKKVHGEAGARVVIEEMLHGQECSILAFVDRKNIYVMESAQDHKPIDDGDTGPMTGGMGAYSPTPIVTDDVMRSIERDVLVPIVDGLIRDGIDYKGVLYAGMMLTEHGARVLEFNCRFGDPETQPLMMRLQSDLLEVMLAVADGKLDQVELKWDKRPALAVVAASGGYPGKYKNGMPITGIADADAMRDVKVFQAGTRMDGKTLVTDGGRVLAVTALGDTIGDAQKRAYQAIGKIHFEGMYYRKDIGKRAIG